MSSKLSTLDGVVNQPDRHAFYGSFIGNSLTAREFARHQRRMKRREKQEMAAYTCLKRERAAAEQVAKARLDAEAALS